MTIFIIILFCLCLGHFTGVTHAEDEPDRSKVVAAICFCVCLALIIPLVYQVGRWAGFWA